MYEEQPVAEVRAGSEDMAPMCERFDRVGYTAAVDGILSEFPSVW